jgi:hypothetical protein
VKAQQRIVPVLLTLCALSLLAGCREGAAPAGTARPYPTAVPAITQRGQDIPRIAVDEAWRRLQAGEAIVIVDARSREEYNIEHVAGAISVPEQELAVLAGELPRDSLLVFY